MTQNLEGAPPGRSLILSSEFPIPHSPLVRRGWDSPKGIPHSDYEVSFTSFATFGRNGRTHDALDKGHFAVPPLELRRNTRKGSTNEGRAYSLSQLTIHNCGSTIVSWFSCGEGGILPRGSLIPTTKLASLRSLPSVGMGEPTMRSHDDPLLPQPAIPGRRLEVFLPPHCFRTG